MIALSRLAILLVIAILAPLYEGSPANTPTPKTPVKNKRYQISSHEVIDGTTDVVTPIIYPPGGQFTSQKSHIKGYTFNIASSASVEVSSIVTIAAQFGLYLVFQDSWIDGVSLYCTGNHTCRGMWTPTVARINGTHQSPLGDAMFSVDIQTTIQHDQNQVPNGKWQVCFVPPDMSEPQCPPALVSTQQNQPDTTGDKNNPQGAKPDANPPSK